MKSDKYADTERSPTLQKMGSNRYDGENGRRRFKMSYIMGDPYALATISIAVVRLRSHEAVSEERHGR